MRSKTLSDPTYGWVAPSTGIEAYDVNGLNQYTDIDGIAPIHDNNGNLKTDHVGRTFNYDAENVLRSVTGLTGGTASYRYHADGSRREKTHNGTTSTFYYMGGLGYLDEQDTAFAADQEIAEYEGGVLKRRFVRLPGSIDEAFLMIDVSGGSPLETWAHTDRLGSVIATTNSTGTVQDTYRYSPYGKPGAEGPGGFPFRFTGQRLDAETGLYYYKARYYDPDTGRFLQTDPIGYDDHMNLYAYVGNDPVNRTDPLGLWETETGTRLLPKRRAFYMGAYSEGRLPSQTGMPIAPYVLPDSVEPDRYMKQLVEHLIERVDLLEKEVESMPRREKLRRFGVGGDIVVNIQISIMQRTLQANETMGTTEELLNRLVESAHPVRGRWRFLNPALWFNRLGKQYADVKHWDAGCIGTSCGFIDPNQNIHYICDIAPVAFGNCRR